VGGLTLANALQHADIDYVLLEKRSDFCEIVGGSICIMGSGNRILDQLGVQKELEALVEPLLWVEDCRSDGTPVGPKADFPDHQTAR